MRLIDADALKESMGKPKDHVDEMINKVISDFIDNAPTVEYPKLILKVKNLTAEDKKHFKECWNKYAGNLLAVPDNYEIIPIERTQGEWICITKSTFPQYQPDEYKCSHCNKLSHIKYYFCPFCGADMRGTDNG